MKVLVTGAAGYIGGKVMRALSRRTWVHTVVGTDLQQPNELPEGVVFVRQDIRDALDPLFERFGIDTVIHTAWVLKPIHDKCEMESINLQGTRNVLDACARNGVHQLLFTSSTTAYGFHPDNDVPLTEESPLRGNDDFTYAKNKKEAEALLAEFSRQHHDVTLTIVRPCFVVGPGFSNPLAQHLQKKFVMLPRNARPWQFVHEDDLVAIIERLLERRLGGIYNVAADGTITFREMVHELGHVYVPLPWSVIFVLNTLAWQFRLTWMTRFPSAAMRMMVEPWIASNDKLKRELGYEFQYDTKAAFHAYATSGTPRTSRRR